jgi:hypothetical protein
MKLRAGSHGQDMWPLCEKHSVAALTYDGIQNIDLARYSRKHRPPGWNQIKGGAAKGSVSYFAWSIRGGDWIFVADALGHKIVGKGFAKATKGHLAYHFDGGSPIIDHTGERWQHLINVDWDGAFVPFPYEHPRAPQHTVLGLKQNEIDHFERAKREGEHRQRGLTEEEVQDTLLLEAGYLRYTPVALRWIRREHVALSNQFVVWLENTHGIRATQERKQIDAAFEVGSKRFLAEFKIAYMGNTKQAIREALGQILEYNHYPPRISHDQWLLILDTEPCEKDKAFLRRLRDVFGLPLTLGWKTDSGFDFEDPPSFRDSQAPTLLPGV